MVKGGLSPGEHYVSSGSFHVCNLVPATRDLFRPATSPGVEPALLEALVRLGEGLSMGGVDTDGTWMFSVLPSWNQTIFLVKVQGMPWGYLVKH